MQAQIRPRLEALRAELQKGQTELQTVEAQRTYLRDTVLRISGAVQVLEELLAEVQSAGLSVVAAGEGESMASSN
jgi:ABC-type transporter Mla subunit MlaD